MPGWVRFTPPLPTKLGQISTDVDSYAHDVLDATGPVALLDYQGDQSFSEILITSPELALEVVDVLTLPDAPEEARALGSTLNEKYAALLPSYGVSVS